VCIGQGRPEFFLLLARFSLHSSSLSAGIFNCLPSLEEQYLHLPLLECRLRNCRRRDVLPTKLPPACEGHRNDHVAPGITPLVPLTCGTNTPGLLLPPTIATTGDLRRRRHGRSPAPPEELALAGLGGALPHRLRAPASMELAPASRVELDPSAALRASGRLRRGPRGREFDPTGHAARGARPDRPHSHQGAPCRCPGARPVQPKGNGEPAPPPPSHPWRRRDQGGREASRVDECHCQEVEDELTLGPPRVSERRAGKRKVT
jgi:hypothetical protein